MTTQIRTRVFKDHTDLTALAQADNNIIDYHEWVFLGDMVYLDALGRPNNGNWHRWMRVRCNNWSCPAQALVHVHDAVVAALGVDDTEDEQ